MKTVKKSLALLLSAIMIFSSFALISSAAEKSPKTINVQVNAPVVGEKADETIKIDDAKYKPGVDEAYEFEVFYRHGGIWSEIESFNNKLPTTAEVFDKMQESIPEGDKYTALERAQIEAQKQMITKGITWLEYDEKEIEEFYKIQPEYKNENKYFTLIKTANYSKEYGLGDETFSSTTKFLKPGDSFKEGKSYVCFVETEMEMKDKLDTLRAAANELIPYYREKNEINKQLSDATEEKAAELNSKLETLEKNYKAKNEAYEAAIKAIDDLKQFENGYPAITVNGEATTEITKGIWLAYYDFGKAAEKQTFLDIIKAFFNNIIEFFRNLFSDIFSR